MSNIVKRLKAADVKVKKHKTPLWTGPEDNGPNGGITYSSLCRFLNCKERFRLHMVEGLRPIDDFNHYLEFGNLWHDAERNHAAGENWELPLLDYAKKLAKKYPLSQEKVDHWYRVVKVTFREY